MIISDFDKTITKKDSLFFFYINLVVHVSYIRMICIPIYILIMFLNKFGWLTNDELKAVGVFLFLKGLKRSDIEYASVKYGKKITLNRFGEELLSSVDECLIITASFETYVRHAVPSSYTVLGSTLSYSSDEVVTGIETNLYGPAKGSALAKLVNTMSFDVFYTDDIVADSSVIPFAKTTKIIKNGKVVR